MNTFDQNLAAWKTMQNEPWMRLRYELAQEYVQQHLPPAPAQILDVGGGNGFDSIPLALAGYQVMVLDSSAGMLDDARSYAESLGVAAHITLVHGSIDTLADVLPDSSADLIFCHNVLQYVAAPAQAIAGLYRLLAPGGRLSIINPNPASEALRLACQTYDLARAAASLHATEHYVPAFDVVVQRYTAIQMIEWLRSAGFDLVGHYGIRCICDYLADNERKSDPAFYADLYALERSMGTLDPYRQIARFMHLIAQKRSGD